jgi:uncharacterized delta-60 repeat protein
MRVPTMFLLLAAASGSAFAADGDLDPAFATDGKVTVSFDRAGGTLRDDGHGVIELPGGKSLVIGEVSPHTAAGLVIGCARLLADGTLDDTYGTLGRKTLQTSLGFWNDVAVDSTDRIALIGSQFTGEAGSSTDTAYRAEMINSNCEYVTGFGTGGVASIDFDLGGDFGDTPFAAVWGGTPRRLYMVGSVSRVGVGDTDIGVAALDATGQPVTAFDGDGKRAVFLDLFAGEPLDFGTSVSYANGKLVVVGQSEIENGRYVIAVARLDATTGAFDTTFCPTTCSGSQPLQAGLRSIDFYPTGGSHFSINADVAPNGQIHIAAALSNGPFSAAAQLVVARLLANGANDGTYGVNFLSVGVFTRPRFALYTDAGFVVAGDAANATFLAPDPHSRMFIGRFFPDSSAPDASFASSSCTASAANWCTFATFPPSSGQPEIVNLNGATRLANGQFMLVGESLFRREAGTVDDFDFAVARVGTSLNFSNGFE